MQKRKIPPFTLFYLDIALVLGIIKSERKAWCLECGAPGLHFYGGVRGNYFHSLRPFGALFSPLRADTPL